MMSGIRIEDLSESMYASIKEVGSYSKPIKP